MNKKSKKRVAYIFLIFFWMVLIIVSLVTRINVKENQNYDSRNEVALYILKYDGKLPPNYITKSQVKKQYPDDYYKSAYFKAIAAGYSIGGGDHDPHSSSLNTNILEYTNNQNLKECDIYLNSREEIVKQENRGPNRLVYSSDGKEVFYTVDHYQNFIKLTKWNINIVSNIFLIIFSVYSLILCLFIIKNRKKEFFKEDIKYSLEMVFQVILAIIIIPFMILFMIIKKIFKIKDNNVE